MKQLSTLCNALTSVVRIEGPTELTVNDIQFDSRAIKPGDLFVATSGTRQDGHAYIAQAVAQGATAVVCQQMPDPLPAATCIQVKDSTVALGELCDAWFDHPSAHLKVVGVTGTNGKTTTATLLYRIVRAVGGRAGLLSTVVNYIDGEEVPATHTTPDAKELNHLMARMVERGGTHCFMEVSSHSIVQHRIAAIRFSGGIFTNLTQDHLDFHKTFDAYLQAKKTFFDHLPREAFALVNKDDRNGLVMVQNTAATVKTYALRSMADYTCRILSEQIEDMFLNLCGQEVFVRFIGRFNAYNLLAVYGAAVQLGIDPQQLAVIMSQLRPVAGRFEYFTSKKGFTAVVDYAHTPDAIENVLDTIRELAGQSGRRIITVVGAGGDRDRGKRPLMARAAVRRSSLVIFTSDNPRSEKPEDIIADMLAGLSEEERAAALVIPDRREAIRTACLTARAGDVVLVAGKGHEDYQIVNGVKHHFDDREEVAKYI